MIEMTVGNVKIQHAADQGGPSVEVLTRLGFMGRFTNAELVAIYTDAKSNVETEIWLDKVRAAEEIDLTDTRTRDGVVTLEANGLIAAGRADEILTPS